MPYTLQNPSVIEGITKALWVPAWADYQDEIDGESPGLGHGIGWGDDHVEFDIEVPHVEAYFDGEDLMVSM